VLDQVSKVPGHISVIESRGERGRHFGNGEPLARRKDLRDLGGEQW
jgi:hypothetical protein